MAHHGVTSIPVTSKPKNQLSNFSIDFPRSIYTDQWAQGRHLKTCHLKTEMGVNILQKKSDCTLFWRIWLPLKIILRIVEKFWESFDFWIGALWYAANPGALHVRDRLDAELWRARGRLHGPQPTLTHFHESFSFLFWK